jgi:hypothetical protein
MNRPLIISIAILFFTTVGLAVGTFWINDAEQKEGIAGYVRVAPIINVAFHESEVSQEPCEQPVTVRCNDNVCAITNADVSTDSCQIVPSKYLKDTLLVSSIILSESNTSNPDLSWMQMEYFNASNGKEMILAQNEMIGIYLIDRRSESEMLFMNFFERAVEVKFTGEMHNGMPDVFASNFDMTVSVYVWQQLRTRPRGALELSGIISFFRPLLSDYELQRTSSPKRL